MMLDPWYPEITERVRRSSHLFVHYSALQRVDDNGAQVVAELTAAGHAVHHISLLPGRNYVWPPPMGCELLVLSGIEKMVEVPRALEQQRAAVNEWVAAARAKVLLLSRRPRSAYPIGDGSSLVLDCADVHLRGSTLAQAKAAELPTPQGAALDWHRSRALVAAQSHAVESLPNEHLVSLAIAALGELGPRHLALLEEWVIDGGEHSIPTQDVADWAQVELVLSSVAAMDPDERFLIVCRQVLGHAWDRGLVVASRASVRASDAWLAAAGNLFEVERRIRFALASIFEERLGIRWAGQVLSQDLQGYISNARGQAATAIPGNPLDWLTLGQLVDLATIRSADAAACGISSAVLSDLRRLLPIRNRFGHMRTIKDEDASFVRTSLRGIQRSIHEGYSPAM